MMNTFNKFFLSSITLTALVATGCPADDTAADTSGSATDSNGTDDATATMPTTMTATMTQGTVDTGTDTTPTTTDPDTATDTATDTDTEGSTSTGPDPNDYDFRDDDPADYTQLDRLGFPAVNTALIESKDLYNTSAPTDDVAGTFLDEIGASLNFIHIGVAAADQNTGLNDDLAALGLAACRHPASPGVGDECVRQGGPFLFPDVVRIDLTAEAGFPNGRRLSDPVMDIILAVLLLDLEEFSIYGAGTDPDPNGLPIDTFFDIDPNTDGNQPLNPDANDVDFGESFPYLGAAHE